MDAQPVRDVVDTARMLAVLDLVPLAAAPQSNADGPTLALSTPDVDGLGEPSTARCSAQPIRSARDTMIPSGPRT
jgi:hypothetical protein